MTFSSPSSDITQTAENGLASTYAVCRDHLRTLDPDRYVACLFAPAVARPHLFALYAFNAEIARVRESVSDVLPGEIRHQWWRDALMQGVKGDAQDNPISQALGDTCARFNLPVETLLALIEARSFDLYDDPMPTWLDLEGYCAETSSALIRLASFILANGHDPGGGDLAGHAGLVYALTGLARAFPLHARRGQCYLPHELLIQCGVSLDAVFRGEDSKGLRAALAALRLRARDHLASLRSGIGQLDARARPAFYPVCLCEYLLDQMEAQAANSFAMPVSISPLMRFYAVARGAWRSRGA